MNVTTAAAIRLKSAGLQRVHAWRRWTDPEPGQAVIVLSAGDDWSSTRTTAQLPTLRAQVYAAPTAGQADAEAIAVAVGDQLRAVLHRTAGGMEFWGTVRVLSSQHVGSALGEVEGHPDWRVRTLTFEVVTA